MTKVMISRIIDRWFVREILIITLFVAFVFGFSYFEAVFTALFGTKKPTVEWSPLYELALDYLMVVAISSMVSLVIAFTIGILIHVYEWDQLRELTATVADFATTFPTIAVIALLVPVLGYGFEPVMAALILYGLLPILTNTVKGLEEVDDAITQAATGMGMSPWQRLFKVELHMAMPMILAGVRTSVIINLAAATVGAVVGAGGLGMPIVSGIRTNEPILILKGAIPVALLALLVDRLFYRFEKRFEWKKS